MTRSTVKKLTEPLEEPERELWRLKRATLCQHQNESLAIAERNLFDDHASSFDDNRTKPVTPLKALREHSLPNSAGFQNPIIIPAEQTGRIVNSTDIWLIQGTYQFTQFCFSSLTEEEGWNRIEEYVQAEPVEPLEWKAPENRLKPSSIEPSKLELKELPEHLEYAFLHEDNQLPLVISSALSVTEKASLLEVMRNHKGAIA
ncbi:hypothetical protein Tco_0318675 [Tanacetum coccineum]